MGVTVRVVAQGRDNGVIIAMAKTFHVELEPGETEQAAAQRVAGEARADLRDFLQDGVMVALSNMEVSVGVVR